MSSQRAWFLQIVLLVVLCAGSPSPSPAQFSPVHGLYGGDGIGLAAIDSSLFAVVSGSCFRSEDNGATWTALPTLPQPQAWSFQACGHFLFVGTREGLFRSSDRGMSWSELPSYREFALPDDPVVYFLGSDDSVLFAGDWQNSFRSTDFGETWSIAYRGMTVYKAMISLVRAGKYLIANAARDSDRRTFLSEDRGVTWNPLPLPSGPYIPPNASDYTVAVPVGKDGLAWWIFLPTYDGTYLTTDFGQTWTVFNKSIPLGGRIYLLPDTAGGVRYVSLSMGQDYYWHLFTAKSPDSEWKEVPDGLPFQSDIRAIIEWRGKLISAAWTHGVIAERTPGRMVPSNTGIERLYVRMLAHAGPVLYVAAGAVGLYRSADGGNSWKEMAYRNNPRRATGVWCADPASSEPTAGSWVYVTDESGWLYRSKDGGRSWTALDSSQSWYGDPIPIRGLPGPTLIRKRDGVSTSTDGGTSWSYSRMLGVQGYLTQLWPAVGNMFIQISPDRIYRSTGSTDLFWIPTQAGWPSGGEVMSAAASDTLMYIFARVMDQNGIRFHLLQFAAGDTAWKEAPFALPPLDSHGGWQMLLSPSGMFAWEGGKLVYRPAGSTSWVDLNVPSPLSLTIIDSTIYVGQGVGLMKGTLPRPTAVGDKRDDPALPAEVTLFQNYPNPFNPVTSIRFALPTADRVRLAVYDMLGREVACLVDGMLPVGEHEARFNGKGLSSGVYFLRLQAGRTVTTKKMTLLQ